MGKLLLLLIPLFLTNLTAQNYNNLNNSSFNKIRIKFLHGFTYTGPAKIQNHKVSLSKSSYHKDFDLKKVKSIEVPKGSYGFEGLLIGAGTGTAIYLIAKAVHQDEEKTNGRAKIYDNRGNVTYQSITIIKPKPFSGLAFVGILGGCTFLGAIIGKNTSKWSTIYKKESENSHLTFSILPILVFKEGLFISLKYNM